MRQKQNNKIDKAYSLLELAISISILSVILVMFMAIGERRYDLNAYSKTMAKIEVIDKAIIANYLEDSVSNTSTLDYHLFACAAPITVAVSNQDFGVAISDENDFGCDTATGIDNVSGEYYHGGIPTRTISIRDSFAFDFWGNRFSFIVNNQLLALFDGSVAVADLDEVLYYIISHGPNGYGAYSRAGSQLAYSNASTEEKYNVHNSSDLAFALSNLASRPRTSNYDDIVYYRTVADFLAETSGGILISESDCTDYSTSVSDSNLRKKIEAQCTVF